MRLQFFDRLHTGRWEDLGMRLGSPHVSVLQAARSLVGVVVLHIDVGTPTCILAWYLLSICLVSQPNTVIQEGA